MDEIADPGELVAGEPKPAELDLQLWELTWWMSETFFGGSRRAEPVTRRATRTHPFQVRVEASTRINN